MGRRPSKGFIDRVFLPGFAFKHHQGSSRWDRLLAGRSAELLVTMDTPPWYYRWVQRGRATSRCKDHPGVQWHPPVRVHEFGPVHSATAQRKQRWLAQARKLGAAVGR